MRHLSPRQLETARLLVEGARDREIAEALGVKEATAKEYVGQLLCVYGAKNRTQFAVWFDREQR